MDEVAIACKGIKKSYGSKDNLFEALKGIDLEIFHGQLTLLVGPSGSGKSTLLSIITTILTPDEGQLLLLGKDSKQMSEEEKAAFRRNNLGIVFQSFFLIPTLTVIENITLPSLISGLDKKKSLDKALELLKHMQIDNRADVSPDVLSKGQQQRVAIARAMINEAEIIVCDEPTSSLDHDAGFAVMNLLRDMVLKSSRAILVVTHDHRIFPFADRIINICDGQIVLDGEEK